MRHAASLLAAMEGISRAAFRVARELAINSRSGLTVRFLAKKLDIPDEEVEYIIDVNHRFLFVDLTKIRIVPEGVHAVKRIVTGLENRGDIPSMFRYIKSLSPQEYREVEELIGLDGPCPKKTAAEKFIEQCYHHPDSVVTYVATRPFSAMAREIFDLVWQSKEGVMPVSKIRALYGEHEYEAEQALSELFQGMALFEMFRFDAEDRLVRVAGLLSEIRQLREDSGACVNHSARLKSIKPAAATIVSYGLGFSAQICRLVAAIAARPVRLRNDGDLFREDRRRLEEVCGEDSDPPLNTCLWAAEGLGWLSRVDNELRAGCLDVLVRQDWVARHRQLTEWLLSLDREGMSRGLLAALLEELKSGTWYRTLDLVRHALAVRAEGEQPVLKSSGGHWHYVSPVTSGHTERVSIRAFEETLPWLGIIDRADDAGDSLIRLTELGRCLLLGAPEALSEDVLPPHQAQIVVQPNFDIVVPTQDMDPLLTVPLDQFAQRTSSGRATVYHLSKETFVHGIQEGHDGEGFIAFLLAHNRGPLPSNVMTTLDDWRGGMKRVRIRTLQVIETDDALVLADLMHRRRLKKFLLPVDPNKVALFTKITKADLVKELEKDGFIVE